MHQGPLRQLDAEELGVVGGPARRRVLDHGYIRYDGKIRIIDDIPRSVYSRARPEGCAVGCPGFRRPLLDASREDRIIEFGNLVSHTQQLVTFQPLAIDVKTDEDLTVTLRNGVLILEKRGPSLVVFGAFSTPTSSRITSRCGNGKSRGGSLARRSWFPLGARVERAARNDGVSPF